MLKIKKNQLNIKQKLFEEVVFERYLSLTDDADAIVSKY